MMGEPTDEAEGKMDFREAECRDCMGYFNI
jgi:hypothetical protein